MIRYTTLHNHSQHMARHGFFLFILSYSIFFSVQHSLRSFPNCIERWSDLFGDKKLGYAWNGMERYAIEISFTSWIDDDDDDDDDCVYMT